MATLDKQHFAFMAIGHCREKRSAAFGGRVDFAPLTSWVSLAAASRRGARHLRHLIPAAFICAAGVECSLPAFSAKFVVIKATQIA